MILRFTDGEHFVNFNSVYSTWNNESGGPDATPIRVSHDDLCRIAGELNFNQFNFSSDLHSEPNNSDNVSEAEIPLF